jgi:hypothetical protein
MGDDYYVVGEYEEPELSSQDYESITNLINHARRIGSDKARELSLSDSVRDFMNFYYKNKDEVFQIAELLKNSGKLMPGKEVFEKIDKIMSVQEIIDFLLKDSSGIKKTFVFDDNGKRKEGWIRLYSK